MIKPQTVVSLLPFAGCLALAVSCGPKKEPAQVGGAQVSLSANAAAQIDDHVGCAAYSDNLMKTDSLKLAYFNDKIVPAALRHKDITAENKHFLLTLQEAINTNGGYDLAQPAPRQILFPVFRLEEGKLGVFGFPHYDTFDGHTVDKSAEYKLIEATGHFSRQNTTEETVYFPQLFEAAYPEGSRLVFVYTDKAVRRCELNNMGMRDEPCLTYYHYPISERTFTRTERPLIGSNMLLDLVYGSYPQIDSLIKNTVRKECHDCPQSGHLMVTFATLKGIPDLYFVYADTFPLNNRLDAPARGLLMKMDKGFTYLWYDEVDLFGCSCL